MLMNTESEEIGELRRLLEKYVPEIASGVVQIRGIARIAGKRSMVMVGASDSVVDVVGIVVGNRGSRIKPLVAELNNEKLDVVRWSESMDQLIGNIIAPNRALTIHYDAPARRATITLPADHKEGSLLDPLRLRLASDALGWKLVME